jgi:hypothetical protein
MPNSRIALYLDLASVSVLFYDMIVVPIQLAWATPMEGFFLWSSWITALFWTLDLIMHFFKAFTKGNEVVR